MPPELAGERLDRGLASLTGVPRRRVRALAEAGRLWISGRATRVLSRPLHTGDVVDVLPSSDLDLLPAAPPPAVTVLHDDAWLLAMDKPPGVATQAPRRRLGHELTAHELLTMHLSWRHGQRTEPLLFHRLDRMTSGVLVFARHHRAAQALARAWGAGRASKCYLAVARGDPGEGERTIRQPIARDPLVNGRFQVLPGGRQATTVVRRIATLGELSLLTVRPLTGRTHQVRVHLSWAGFPVAGDPLYGGGEVEVRPFLHAWRLALPHPGEDRTLALVAPLPPDMVAFLAARGFAPEALPA